MPAYNPQMGGDKPMPGLNSDPNPGPTNPLPPAPPGHTSGGDGPSVGGGGGGAGEMDDLEARLKALQGM